MIFSGVEVMFFLLGFLTCLAMFGFVRMNQKYNMDWKSWTLAGVGVFLFLFCLAWSISSVLEGEPRAASMGMVVFGIPALIFGVLTRRMVLRSQK